MTGLQKGEIITKGFHEEVAPDSAQRLTPTNVLFNNKEKANSYWVPIVC